MMNLIKMCLCSCNSSNEFNDIVLRKGFVNKDIIINDSYINCDSKRNSIEIKDNKLSRNIKNFYDCENETTACSHINSNSYQKLYLSYKTKKENCKINSVNKTHEMTTQDYIQKLKEMRNDLMKNLY